VTAAGQGFSESRWQALLDDAGYPKAPPLRRPLPPATAPRARPRRRRAGRPGRAAARGGYPVN